MKKFTKAILGTTTCVLMGAATLGLTGCIGSAGVPADLTNKVDDVVTKTDTIITDTTAIKTSITAIETAIEALTTQAETQNTAVKNEITAQTTALTTALTELKTLVNNNKASIDAIAPKLDNINTAVSSIAQTINTNINEESAKVLTSLQAINTSLTTINTKVESIVAAIGSQTDEITGTITNQTSELTTILNAQTTAIQEELAEQTDRLLEKLDELKEEVNHLLNKQDRLTHEEAWEAIEYSLSNLLTQDTTKFKASAIRKLSMFGQSFEESATSEQLFDENYGLVSRTVYTEYEDISFKIGNYYYTATIADGEITNFVKDEVQPTSQKEVELPYSLYNLLHEELGYIGLTENNICLTTVEDGNHKIHVSKEFVQEYRDGSDEVLGTITSIIKVIYSINADGKIVSIEASNYPISSTVEGMEMAQSSMQYDFEYFEENPNTALVETYGALIEEYIAQNGLPEYETPPTTPSENTAVVNNINTPTALTAKFTGKILPGDEVSIVCSITNNSGSDILTTFAKTSASLYIAGQDVSSEGLEYFEYKNALLYLDSEMTTPIQANEATINIANNQTIYLKLIMGIDVSIPSQIGGYSLSENNITYNVNIALNSQEDTSVQDAIDEANYTAIYNAIESFKTQSLSSNGVNNHFTRNMETYECVYRQLAYGATQGGPCGEGFVKVVKQSNGTYVKYQKWDEGLEQGAHNTPSGIYTFTATIIDEAEARRICLEDCLSFFFPDNLKTYNELVKTYGKDYFTITKNGNEYIYSEVRSSGQIIKFNSTTNSVQVCIDNNPAHDGQGNDLPLEYTTYTIGFNQTFFDSFDVSTSFPTPTAE